MPRLSIYKEVQIHGELSEHLSPIKRAYLEAIWMDPVSQWPCFPLADVWLSPFAAAPEPSPLAASSRAPAQGLGLQRPAVRLAPHGAGLRRTQTWRSIEPERSYLPVTCINSLYDVSFTHIHTCVFTRIIR